MLRAATACTFLTCQLPKVVWEWCVLHILTSKCASRHNGVQFLKISTSKSVPNPWDFHTFDLDLRTHKFQIIGKTQGVSRLSYLFTHLDLLSSDCLFFDLLSASLLFSGSSHLCFSSVHAVGSLTSKLASINIYIIYIYMVPPLETTAKLQPCTSVSKPREYQ